MTRCLYARKHSILGDQPYNLELLRILFYLTQAYYQLNQYDQGYAELEQWTEKLKHESPHCRCILLSIRIITLKQQKKSRDAAMLYDEVINLHLPNSYIITSSLYRLKKYSDLYEIFLCLSVILTPIVSEFIGLNYSIRTIIMFLIGIVVIPTFQDDADSLVKLGDRCRSSDKREEAESNYLQAINIYSNRFPLSQNYAKCLSNLGALYSDMRKCVDSEKWYLLAINIYSANYPQNKDYAQCLYDLGLLYEEVKRKLDARQKFETAGKIYRQLGDETRVRDCNRALARLY